MLLFSLAFIEAHAADFKREVIYQIVTDRFFDGSTSNNNPPQSEGLYDASKTNWRTYWGGDLQGIQQKMSYLTGMGITAILISPPVDNLNANISDANGNATASYHGYQPRDLKRIEEHFGNADNTWTEFDNLVNAAHRNGIKVIVDFVINHSTQQNAGEFGSIYDNGTFLGNYANDTNGYFHHNPNISGRGWDDPYQVQYYTLFDLADLNQEHPTIDSYLKAAAGKFQQHGVDGFRLDAVKHATWGWTYSLVNSIHSYGDSFVFGEWYQRSSSDPLYRDSYKFANKSGVSLLDFPLNTAIRNVFASNSSFSEIDNVILRESSDFTWDKDLVTFIDNHDMPRFLSLNNNINRLHEALAFTLSSRGIPCIYYGSEQYLHNDTAGGADPYNRSMMASFDTTTTAYRLVNRLSNLRRSNPAVPYGSTTTRWINNDVYIYERRFFGSVVLVAINKNDNTSYPVTGLKTALPAGTYSDYLRSLLGGPSITVMPGSAGSNSVTNFTLPAHTVSVWEFVEASASSNIHTYAGENRAQPLTGLQESPTTRGSKREEVTLNEFDRLPEPERKKILYKSGPLLPATYNLNDIPMRAFIKGNWPLLVAYSLKKGTATLTIAVDGVEPFSQELQAGKDNVIIKIPARFGKQVRVASISVKAAADADQSNDSSGFEMRAIGILEETVNSSGTHHYRSPVPVDLPLDNITVTPGVIRTSRGEQVLYKFFSHSPYISAAAEFFLFTRTSLGLVPVRVFSDRYNNIRANEVTREKQWNGKNWKGEFSFGIHRLEIRTWRDPQGGSKWFGPYLGPQVRVVQ